MAKHRYLSQRLDKHTYIKGEFRGKYTGDLDKGKSDPVHERFFDLEITEGDIITSQEDIRLWPDANQPLEFADAPTFPVSLMGEMRVTLRYLDGSFKYFKLKLQELKLVNCRLTKQHHEGNKVYGVIEGDICGYLLHYDTIVHEIVEEKKPFVSAERVINDVSRPRPQLPDIINTKAWYDPYKKPFSLSFLSFLSGIMFLIGILTVLKHPWLLSLFLLLAFLSFARPYNFLARTLGLRLSNNSATLIFTLLFGATVYCLVAEHLADNVSYGRIAEKEYKRSDELSGNKSQKLDSFNRHFDAGKMMVRDGRNDDALHEFQRAALFAGAKEQPLVNIQIINVYTIQAEEFVRSGKSKEAINIYSKLLAGNPSNATYLYKRAKCYVTIGRTKEAVKDLRISIDLGDKPSALFHDKINPIKKRIAYYVTRCCDGTTSDAKGQGACSHHGGVCDWNDPVYEEYREY